MPNIKPAGNLTISIEAVGVQSQNLAMVDFHFTVFIRVSKFQILDQPRQQHWSSSSSRITSEPLNQLRLAELILHHLFIFVTILIIICAFLETKSIIFYALACCVFAVRVQLTIVNQHAVKSNQ